MKKIIYFIAVTMLSFTAHAGGTDIGNSDGPKFFGLVCDDDEHYSKVVVDIETDGDIGYMALRGASSLTPFMVMDVESAIVVPILNNQLGKMNNVTLKSKSAALKFRVDGYDFQGNARLEIVIQKDGESLKLSSCNRRADTKISL